MTMRHLLQGTGSTIAALLTLALLSSGVAWADKKKEARVDESVLAARVQSVDAVKNTLTVFIARKDGEKRAEEKTFTLSPQVRIAWLLGKGQEAKPGQLAELQPGDHVTLRLSPDGKEVRALEAHPPMIHGIVRHVNAQRCVITIGRKEKGGPAELEIFVPPQAKILISDGVNKNETSKEGKLTDLSEDLAVSVVLALDRKTAQVIHAQGPTISGTVRGYDAGTRTLTIQLKENGQLVEKSYRLAGNARLEGDLTPGEPVQIRLAVGDRSTAVAVHVPKKK
ncbi:MAG: hypothetical protein RMJ82_04780 [Gemmatales bacterium]|nr:hypothetical protein [Gemmatales bacterium]